MHIFLCIVYLDVTKRSLEFLDVKKCEFVYLDVKKCEFIVWAVAKISNGGGGRFDTSPFSSGG